MANYQAFQTYQPNYRGDQQFVKGNPLADLLTPAFLQENYLAGLPLEGTAVKADLSTICQQKIDAAIGEFELKMETFVVPRTILSMVMGQSPIRVTNISASDNPTGMVGGTPAVAGVDYDLLESPYDYTKRRFQDWDLIKVRHSPILSVESVLMALPPNFGILQVPPAWITPNPNQGIIRIVPVEGAMAVSSPGAGMWLPFFTMGKMDYVPQFQQVSYTAGIYPVPNDMIDAIAKLATAKVLEVYNRAFYPGVASFSHSVDGFSQNVTLRGKGPFMDDIENLKQEVTGYIESWKKGRRGPVFGSLGR